MFVTEPTSPLVEALTYLAEIERALDSELPGLIPPLSVINEAELDVIEQYAREVEMVDGIGAGLIREQADLDDRSGVISRARSWAGPAVGAL